MGATTAFRPRIVSENGAGHARVHATSAHSCPTNPLSRLARWQFPAVPRSCGGDSMIDWTEELLAQIEGFSSVALSYLGIDGYSVVLPLPRVFDLHKRCFILPIPHQRPMPAWEEQVSLTL